MDLITLLLAVLLLGIIFGLLYWVIGILPMPPIFKTIAYVVLVIILVIILIKVLVGLLGGLGPLKIGHVALTKIGPYFA